MGDEVRRTQHGNNNAYCQNNELSWFDWDLVVKHADLLRFVRQLIAIRGNFMVHRDDHPLALAEWLGRTSLAWHGIHLQSPDLSRESHSLALTATDSGGRALHLILNAFWKALTFDVPPHPEKGSMWQRAIDTSLSSPQDILNEQDRPNVSLSYHVQPRSIVLLLSGMQARDPVQGESIHEVR